MIQHKGKRDVMGKYGDMIDLPHHVSNVHPQMPLEERAAQFFALCRIGGSWGRYTGDGAVYGCACRTG